jgi:hypothetical protein
MKTRATPSILFVVVLLVVAAAGISRPAFVAAYAAHLIVSADHLTSQKVLRVSRRSFSKP